MRVAATLEGGAGRRATLVGLLSLVAAPGAALAERRITSGPNGTYALVRERRGGGREQGREGGIVFFACARRASSHLPPPHSQELEAAVAARGGSGSLLADFQGKQRPGTTGNEARGAAPAEAKPAAAPKPAAAG